MQLRGTGTDAVRHEVGLVLPSGRSDGGFRLYTDDDIERLQLVKHMTPLDFSLDPLRRDASRRRHAPSRR
jgi:DNA-binding transcriptional MerR regulator